MNSENQFETIILKILESDPQLLVAASVVLVILIVIGVFFVKTLKKLFSDETQTPPLSEKDRLKKLEELAKEEEELREQRDEAKLQKISEKEDSAKLELQQQEVQLRERQILQRDIPVVVEQKLRSLQRAFLINSNSECKKPGSSYSKPLGRLSREKKKSMKNYWTSSRKLCWVLILDLKPANV